MAAAQRHPSIVKPQLSLPAISAKERKYRERLHRRISIGNAVMAKMKAHMAAIRRKRHQPLGRSA
jgi:hypothetical protein